MNKDFKVGQANELIKESRVFDLHNCFDFSSLTISGACVLILTFKPNTNHGAGYSGVTLQAQSVDYLEISPRFGSTRLRDLEEIGYKSRGDHDDNWLLNESQATAADDLFFRFNDGHYVRFHCERATLIEESPTPEAPPSTPRG
jgi:hypothetical protein